MRTEDEEFYRFARSLLSIDPKTRPTATEALRHPFLQDIDPEQVKFVPRT
jgi:serine/threonine protein kinase